MKPVWSTVVANFLMSLAEQEGRYLTHMQLQKLVYISNGWSLQIFDRSLTLDEPEAWRFGPVYRLLWERLKHAGNYPITVPIPDNQLFPYESVKKGLKLRSEDEKLLRAVFRAYGYLQASSFHLSRTRIEHLGERCTEKTE